MGGTRVALEECVPGSMTQKWSKLGESTDPEIGIFSVGRAGLCLDVAEDMADTKCDDKAGIWVQECGEAPSQRWRWADVGDGKRQLVNQKCEKCLDIEATDDSGAFAVISDC